MQLGVKDFEDFRQIYYDLVLLFVKVLTVQISCPTDSHKFGYGLMDAGKMVDIALTWRSLPSKVERTLEKHTPQA